MQAIKSFSMNASQAWESSIATIDHAAGFIGHGVDQVIARIDLKFGEAEVGEKLQRVWSWLQNGIITPDDSTHQKVRKAAFALFVSLPALFFIKDIIKTTSPDHMKSVDSLGECLSTLIKMAVYTSIVLTALDIALSFAPKREEQAPTAGETTPVRDEIVTE